MSDAEGIDEFFDVDIRQLDASYEPFPPFVEWANIVVDTPRWEAFTAEMNERRQSASPELLERAQKIVERAAAIDTGAIEGLYSTDRGFTFSDAKQVISWEAMVEKKAKMFANYSNHSLPLTIWFLISLRRIVR